MKDFSTPLIEKTKEYVNGLFANNFSEDICYHNIDHTLDVVEGVKIIASKSNVNLKDLETLIIAAWFHDSGYFMGSENHEFASANLASSFLSEKGVDLETVIKVRNCILCTCIPQKPVTLLEKIICDADMFHLASENFFQKTELLRLELTLSGKKMTHGEWLEKSRNFIESHNYHTKYGLQVLNPKKNENLVLLRSKIEEISLLG